MALEIFKGQETVILRDDAPTTNIYYEFSLQHYPTGGPKLKITSSGGAQAVSLIMTRGIDVAILQEILDALVVPVNADKEYTVD